jgi:hypothetical protein
MAPNAPNPVTSRISSLPDVVLESLMTSLETAVSHDPLSSKHATLGKWTPSIIAASGVLESVLAGFGKRA